MKKLILFLLIVLCIFLVHSSPTKTDKKVLDYLEKNPTAKVIVELKKPSPTKGLIFTTQKTSQEINSEKKQIKEKILNDLEKEKINHVFKNSLAIEISENELKNLEKESNIVSIKIDVPVQAFLEDSVSIINASTVWPIQVNEFNITGFNESICIIDTGIDTDHPDLRDKIVGQYCYCSATEGGNSSCCADGSSESNTAEDNHGHGTHVAGIAAASGNINGVAIESNIVAIKTLNSTGSGYSSDTAAAIEWCSNDTNIQSYNISVISISLGGGQYNSYCDGESSSTTDAINTAVGKNISVIIATGNTNAAYPNANAGVGLPACIENATRVSAVDKSDNMASYAFRNSNFSDILLAPGSNINSTYFDGTYYSQSGTSMAAPHVAGVFAIFREFFTLQNNRMPTTSEIKTTLNNTGKLIDDSSGSGLNFSRVDIYEALFSIDSSTPTVNLISPEDNEFSFSKNITFECEANDFSLSNTTFYLWNSTALYNTTSRNLSGISSNTQFNLTNLPYDNYEWNCLTYDHNNNFSFASLNYSLTIEEVNTVLNSPLNNTFTNQQSQNFNCSSETSELRELSNITFYLWNATELIYNISQNISGTSNTTIFNYNLTNETSYSWNCKSINNESNFTWAKNNFTLTYDITKPNITIVNPLPSSETSNSVSKTFYYNVSDNYNVNNCSLIVNNAISSTNSSISTSSTNNFTSTFTPGTYNWQINCTDIAGNTENSSSNSFTITTPTVTTTGGSGGGGGGGSSTIKTYNPTQIQLSSTSGYTQSLNKKEKIKFPTSTNALEDHTITVNFVGENYADITVQSNPINFVLYINEEKKLNLTSADYYDFYIKLNNISNNKANLTIKSILELIPQNFSKVPVNKTEQEKDIDKEIEEIEKLENWRDRLIITLIIVIFVIIILERELKKKNKKQNASTKTKRKGK